MPNQGDVWQLMLDSVGSFFEEVAAHEAPANEGGAATVAAVLQATKDETPVLASETIGEFLDVARLLGTRTAQLHAALGSPTDDPAFTMEPFSALHQRSRFQTLRNQAAGTFGILRKRADDLPLDVRAQAARALELSPAVQARLTDLTRAKMDCGRIRIHADFHAGQVLWTGKDVVFIDFEGEPGRPLSERRHKKSALTDVAGMLRSFHYAAFGTLLNPHIGGAVRPEDVTRLEPWADFWYRWVASEFLRAYLAESAGKPFVPRHHGELETLLNIAMLQKVLYELDYELNNRPDWVSIPLRGLLDLFA